MADNITVKDGTGTSVVVASKDNGGVQIPKRMSVDSSGTEILPATAALQTTANTEIGGLTETAPASDTASSGLNGRLQRIAQNLTTFFGAKVTAVAALGSGGSGVIGWLSAMMDRLAATGVLLIGQNGTGAASRTNGLPLDPPRLINAAGSTLTRPANTTAYAAGDSISDNATAGSVTALTVNVAEANDLPVAITGIELDTTDTGLAAGTQVRVHCFASNPTSGSGVGAGDNAAWSNKRAGWRGSFLGTFKAFSDGGKAICVPEDGQPYMVSEPGSGAQTLWWQAQAVTGFTPSANSTTIIPRFKGFQGRA